MVRIGPVRKGIVLPLFQAAADKPARRTGPAAVGQGVAVHPPGAGIGIEGRFATVPFLGDDIDDTADGTAAVADGATALGDFDVVDGPDAGQTGQIDAAPAIAGTLGVSQALAVDEDQDPVVAIEFDIRGNTGHHFVDRYTRDALQGLLDRCILVGFHVFRRNDGRIRLAGRDGRCGWNYLRFR